MRKVAVAAAVALSAIPGAVLASGGSNPLYLTPNGTTLYFTANDGVHGQELWRSQGTASTTSMVKDVNPGAGDGAARPLSP